MSMWQNEEQRCAVVLREVFGWLGGRELARAGAACRAWRRAAAEPALWRRLLRANHDESVETYNKLVAAVGYENPQCPSNSPVYQLISKCLKVYQLISKCLKVYQLISKCSERGLYHQVSYPEHRAGSYVAWRQEFVCSSAGWNLVARHRAADTLLHAALASACEHDDLLALAGADASLAVWRRGAGWSEVGRTSLRARGWRAVARAQWAGCDRLLLAGPLALAADWELLVLRIEVDGRCGPVASRVRCSAGAAGCWADAAGNAFLSFELHRLGAGLYCTTVWLNAATQETESEYAGVTSPLLRIYNEDGAHLTHALVAEERLGARWLVAGAGCLLSAWPVLAPRPPPLVALAGGGLAERVRRHRLRRVAPEQDAPEPDEAAVRAGCTPPAHLCRLAAPLVGLVLHESGRCMWAVCSDGSAACVSLAALQLLVHVHAPTGAGGAGLHYVQPAASASIVAWPAGGYSARVEWLMAASCARGAGLAHDAAAVCCVLPRADEMLVLAGDELYVWRNRVTPQWDPREAAMGPA